MSGIEVNQVYRFDPRIEFLLYDEFWTSAGYNGLGQMGWAVVNSGTASGTAQSDSGATEPGSLRVATGTTTTGYAAIRLGTSNIVLGGAAMRFQTRLTFNGIADATNDYTIRFGFGDSNNGDFADGVYFTFDRSISATHLIISTAASGVRTHTVTDVTLQSLIDNIYNEFAFDINLGATEVKYYINNVLIGTTTTNIPTNVSTERTGFYYQVVKLAGTSGRRIDIDYFYLYGKFAQPRYARF